MNIAFASAGRPSPCHLTPEFPHSKEQPPSWAILAIVSGIKKALEASSLVIKCFGLEVTHITSAYSQSCLPGPTVSELENWRHLENSTNDYRSREMRWRSRLQTCAAKKLSWDAPWKIRSPLQICFLAWLVISQAWWFAWHRCLMHSFFHYTASLKKKAVRFFSGEFIITISTL